MAGYLAPNVAKNTLIPHGVSMLFKRDGATDYVNLGDLSDVSITPTIEFLEYSSSRFAKSAIEKRIGQNKGITIEATVNEVAPETLRIAFFGNAKTDAAVTNTIIEKVTLPAGMTSSGGDYDAPLSGNPDAITSVTTADGATTLAATAYSISGVPDNTLRFFDGNAYTYAGQDLIVTYTFATAATASTFEIGKEDQQTGAVQFHVRNNEGGLGQRILLEKVHIAASGAIPIAPDAVQNFPITITALVKNGKLGDFTYYDN